jgi:hypothetical protein
MPIYFHETIDTTIVREKALMYLDKVGRSAVGLAANRDAPMRNVGKWVVNWTTGRWIEVVGLWEMSSWEWFIEHFTKSDLMLDHPEGHEQYRSGGFDRLLQPADGTPTLTEIQEQGLRAPFIMQETVEVAPGEASKYLGALRRGAEKIGKAERGLRLQGAYKVLLRDEREVVIHWAFADLRAFTTFVSDPGVFPELQAWREEARDGEQSYIAKLLEPTSWSALR